MLTHREANATLADLEDTRLRSARLWGYQKQAPFLFLWGGLYAIGYVLSYLRPAQSGVVWIAIGTGGGLASFLVGRRAYRGHAGTGLGIRFWLVAAAIALFAVGTANVLRITDGRQIAAFVPLLVGLVYALYGTVLSPRLGFVGFVLSILTLVGYFAVPGDVFLLWMAVAGGGALVLGGLWLRRL